ncbi:peroxiredoxin-like family protein [Streptomyces sp. SL13]|uniref:thioredoxin-dependent peroxiredoxin n=1 Tax=Streptantibioticus silvisoli TaxID=2705255 RepID=A0AA90HCM0_9ACTN|nr:peroxiredoxin-like family protein [Streptantibioticus silvisoli]MDI5973892.1 peroxiredoxin-like family protein [Streptantibioticus silvisoli]
MNKDTTVADRSAEVGRQAGERLPGEVTAAFEAELARLVAAGVPAGVAAPGAKMPDGDLLDMYGSPTTLAAVLAGRPAVVVFYRGAWCPYCNVALHAYQEALVDELDARGVALVAVSPQKPDESLSLAEKHALTYAVVSDPGNRIARQLGIVFTLGRGAREAQAKLGLDLAAVNADGTAELPLATTVLVDTDGTIRWIDVHPDYTTRSEPAEILEAVAAL